MDIQSLSALFLLYFAGFFALINPLGSMTVFLAMTNKLNERGRRRVAFKAVITAFVILMIFAFGGQMLFKFFGISANGFRIVGGIIFFLMGYDMLNAKLSSFKQVKNEKELVDPDGEDLAITPLGIPIIAGPGAITNAIVLMEDAPSVTSKVVLIFTIILVLTLTFFIYIGGAGIIRFLGETVNKLLLKVMGLILMVVAVEFFFSGLEPILQRILKIN